jgi:hypothetical protein
MQRKISRTAEAEDEKKRAQEEYGREQKARDRERLEARRRLCTFLKFWTVSADRRCTRARHCAGNVEACFDLFWPLVPEDIKNEIWQAITFMNEGMPPRQTAIEARAYVAQRKRIEEETKARDAACRAAQPLPAPAPVVIARTHAPARRTGPRVRGL